MINVRNLVKDYGPIRAVDDVTFDVRKGDILGFLGPNGAGKSTTMKMITGFLPPTSGRTEIAGIDVAERPREAKRHIGYLPESGPLYPEMTVIEFLRFIAEMRGLSGAKAAAALDRAIELCHLRAVRHQPIETLSKGFRQRVGMAQAVMHDPPCLILDEPTDGLDPNQKQEVRRLIASMAKEKAIILSTHILEEVEAMCNRVIIIAAGRILVNETPADLLRRHPNYGAVELELAHGDTGNLRNTVKDLDGVASVESLNGKLLIRPKNQTDLKSLLWNRALAEKWPMKPLEPANLRLEDVFRNLTQKDGESIEERTPPAAREKGQTAA
jgi:ABC-2 type transport system ATP-binding protein